MNWVESMCAEYVCFLKKCTAYFTKLWNLYQACLYAFEYAFQIMLMKFNEDSFDKLVTFWTSRLISPAAWIALIFLLPASLGFNAKILWQGTGLITCKK